MGRMWVLCFCLLLLAGCAGRAAGPVFGVPEPVAKLDRDYQRIRLASERFGPGGLEVLEVAYEALREGKLQGRHTLVELADLWAHAVREGEGTFKESADRWGLPASPARQSFLGQATVGPWQMSMENVRNVFGATYGINSAWTDSEIVAWLRLRPQVHARMAADLVQRSYDDLGQRGPYAIQQSFMLEEFVRGKIGQGPWDGPVVGGEGNREQTGFYGKQLLVGSEANPDGLLYWLCVTEDDEGIRGALRLWRDQRQLQWDIGQGRAVFLERNAGMAITPKDLQYLRGETLCHARVHRLVGEVLAEGR